MLDRGACNTLVAKYAGNASLILGFDDLADRYLHLILDVTPDRYWAGVLTNLPRDEVPVAAKKLDDLADINRQHPIFCDNYIETVVNKFCPHLLPCLSGDYETALSSADSQLMTEEIILIQVMRGEIELAMSSISRLSEQWRKDGVHFVTAIELHRKGRHEEAEQTLKVLGDDFFDDWGLAQMALGISNRVPWTPYPFPDY